LDLVFNALLDWGHVCKPKVARAAEKVKGVNRSSGSGCKGASSVSVKELFSYIFLKDAKVGNELFVSVFVQDPFKREVSPQAS
jgi:hypothetical protein